MVEIKDKNIMVTGGAGFIGSNLVDTLIRNNNVVVFDNLSTGKIEHLQKFQKLKQFRFIKGDMLDKEAVNEALKDVDLVFHLAANPDVKIGIQNTRIHLEQNVIATMNLLEAMRLKNVKEIAFTSSSVIYGEASVIPTPEDYGPLIPISLYGASKLAAESYITAYSKSFGFDSIIYRFANIVGEYSNHGVICDFIKKLSLDTKHLNILGDGLQSKSYLYISECIDAMLFGLKYRKQQVEMFNIGSVDIISVNEIANIVVKAMKLHDVEYHYTKGLGGRGWIGDVKVMQLSIQKLIDYGFVPKYNSKDSITKAIEVLINEIS